MTTTTITAVAAGDHGQPVHPAAQNVLDAIAQLAGYQPTSPQDAAHLVHSLGGNGTGPTVWGSSAVNELIDVMLHVATRTRRQYPEAAAAAMYAEDALSIVRDEWLDGATGELAVCQATTVLANPTVARDLDFRSQFMTDPDES